MDAERWARITELLDRLGEIDDQVTLEARLDEWCADDATLRAEVLELLAAQARHSDFLSGSAVEEAEALIGERLQQQWIGRSLGAWTIEAPISQGGMGTVFRVRRSQEFDQTGALKIIRAGFESEELIRRFAQERALLAQLNHPNIARLLDGGTTEDGLPWLVMELVEGEMIDQWCQHHQLSLEARLGLFEQVCAAVHFAHQKLIIHRDIKAGNVLVDASGQVKLLDFGIARLIEPGVEFEATLTQQRRLTPSSASPEQFLGQAVTTASDVYALGLLLYRLLCGQPAYAIDATTALKDVQRLICRDMPTRPSEVVARSAGDKGAASGLRPDRQARRLRGDLDTIVLKALRKEPERRYGSVEELAEDLRRHRAGLPVLARPDSVRYRAGKFIHRHWAGLAATSIAFAALAIGLVIAVNQAELARAERDRAELINQFLQSILVEADPYQAGAEATVRDVLRKAGELVESRFSEEPGIEAALRHTIGYTQLSLMQLEDAQANLARAFSLNQHLYGDHDDRTLMSRAYLAWIDYRRGQYQAAEEGYGQVLAMLDERNEVVTRATIHNDFGVILAEQERWDEALMHQQDSLDLWLAHDPERPEIGILFNNIALNLHGMGELEQARQWYEKGLERQRTEAPDGVSPDLAINLNNLGILLRDLGQPEAALPYHQEALDMRITTLGEEHAFTGMGHLTLGRLLLDLDQAEEARLELEAAVRISEATLEPEQLQVLVARASLARAMALNSEAEDARALLEQVIPMMREQNIPASFLEQAEDWYATLTAKDRGDAEH